MRIDARSSGPDEAPGLALHQCGDDAHPTVGCQHDVERPSFEGRFQRFGKVGIGMDVLDRLREFDFVLATVQDGHLIAPLQQTVDDVRSGRPGTAYDQRFHGSMRGNRTAFMM